MSGGTGALIARFLATASDRLTQMGEVLSTLRSAADVGDVVKRIGRDLHTLKGEARLLGLPEIERVAHASEDMLFSHHHSKQITELTEQLLYEAIDTIFTSVQARGEGSEVNASEIDAVVNRLRAAVIAGDDDEDEAFEPHTEQPKTERPQTEDPLADHRDPKSARADEPAPEEEKPRGPQQSQRTMHVAAELLDGMTDEVSNLSGSLVRNRQYLAAFDGPRRRPA